MFSILNIIFNNNGCPIRPLMHVLVKIFNDFLLCTTFDIICASYLTQRSQLYGTTYPSVINAHTMNSCTPTNIPTSISNKTIFFNNGIIRENFTIMFWATTTIHAWCITNTSTNGPWIICLVTVSNARGSVSLARNSHIWYDLCLLHTLAYC